MFHIHRWTTISIKHGSFQFGGGEGTWLLQKCDCGKVRTEAINGHWSLKELTEK